jgi:hypothetical protein
VRSCARTRDSIRNTLEDSEQRSARKRNGLVLAEASVVLSSTALHLITHRDEEILIDERNSLDVAAYLALFFLDSIPAISQALR